MRYDSMGVGKGGVLGVKTPSENISYLRPCMIGLIQLIFINKSVDFSHTFFPRFIYTIINIKYTIYLYT